MEARKLKLPKPLSLSSLLFDPNSLSLSLSHSDSSLSLYPSLSHTYPHTIIPPLNSSSTFFNVKNNNNELKTGFLASSSTRDGGLVLLRFWVCNKTAQWSKARVFCNQKGLEFDESRFGVVFDVSHGDEVRLVGSVNVFGIYSVSNNKIWVFAVREFEGGLKLMRCAVIECDKLVFSMSLDFGFLVLGEENGVRVFRLRPLVKGRVKKDGRKNKDLEIGKKLRNGVIVSNGCLEGKSPKNCVSTKLKSVKLKQDSKDYGACFVEFKNKEKDTHKQTKEELQLAKANSIQALSPDKFLVLDSTGYLHLMCLSNTGLASEIRFSMKQLPNIMKVQKLAVHPDISTKTRYVWISDGYHTVHAIAFPGVDVSFSESSTQQCEDLQIQSSVSHAIFTSEKIQEMVPLATNAVLVLGQGSLFVYSIS